MTRYTRHMRGLAIGFLLAAALPCLADSDGHYCAGTNYLAYEVRQLDSPDPAKGHEVRIVRFGPAVEAFEVTKFSIPDFQTHAMACGESSLRLGGWDREPVAVDVEFGGRLEVTREPGRPFQPPAHSPPTLGAWLQPASVDLASTDPDHRYQLVLERDEIPILGGFEHRTRARIEKRTLAGDLVAESLLLEASREESVD